MTQPQNLMYTLYYSMANNNNNGNSSNAACLLSLLGRPNDGPMEQEEEVGRAAASHVKQTDATIRYNLYLSEINFSLSFLNIWEKRNSDAHRENFPGIPAVAQTPSTDAPSRAANHLRSHELGTAPATTRLYIHPSIHLTTPHLDQFTRKTRSIFFGGWTAKSIFLPDWTLDKLFTLDTR